ncbi:MAG: SCO family protein [Acidobacteriota bacterium]
MMRALVLAFAAAACSPTWHPARAQQVSLYDHPWVWLDDHGERAAFSQWRGTPVVLAAMYTTCFETCPRTLAKLKNVYAEFERDHRRAAFIVVTIDPETDTPERLRAFRASRHLPDSWHLWTGGSAETKELVDLLGIHLMDMESHLVHDSKIVMFDDRGVSTSEYEVL